MRKLFCLILFALTPLGMSLVTPLDAQEASWEALQKAQSENKTKTVIDIAARLKQKEIAAENWGKACEALVKELTARANLDGGGEKMLGWFDAELEKAPREMQPVLWTLRGAWIQRQYSSWRWNRSASSDEMEVADPENLDVTTWSEGRKFHEALRSYAKALEEPQLIRQLGIEDFEGTLSPGPLDGAARPTVYDFLVREVLGAIGALAQVEADFVPKPDNALLPRADFVSLELPAGEWSPSRKLTDGLGWQDGFRLWQELIRFHAASGESEALMHADLDRLAWMREAVSGDPVAIRKAYRARLREIIESSGDWPVASWARLMLGQSLLRSGSGGRDRSRQHRGHGNLAEWGDPVEAHQVFKAGAAAHPEHAFGKMCADQVAMMEMPAVGLRLRRSWIDGNRVVELRSRNVKKLWFRVYPVDFDAKRWLLDKNLPQLHNEVLLKKFLGRKPGLSWSVEIPDQGDFAVLPTNVSCPEKVPMGLNVLMVSDREDFSGEDSLIAGGAFFRSDISLALWNGSKQGKFRGYVLDSIDGSPVPQVEVDAWWRQNGVIKNRHREARSDGEGFFTLEAKNYSQISAEHRDGSAILMQAGYSRGDRDVSTDQEVLFFIDRQAYRPGQKLRFKGIVSSRGSADKAREIAAKGTEVEVRLVGANGDTVETLKLTTNGFGSISGEFDLPTVGLLGRHRLDAPNFRGNASFRVEEYKRPVFEAEVEPAGVPGALGGEVTARVIAKAFSGEAMDGARVSWTVERRALWVPRWGAYGRVIPNFGNGEQIASGEGSTDKQGHLDITFVAEPSPLVELTAESRFSYSVDIEITAPSGESKDLGWSTTLGFADFRASLALDENHWTFSDREYTIQLNTESWQGVPVEREGTVKIFRVKQPERVVDGWERNDPVDPEEARKGDQLVKEMPAATRKGVAKLGHRFEPGEYRILYQGKDDQGRPAKAETSVRIFDPQAESTPIRTGQALIHTREAVSPGGTARIFWASGFERARACLEFFHDGKMLRRHWTAPGRTQKMIEFGITEAMRGGVRVRVTQVSRDQSFHREITLPVSDSNERLEIEWHHLSDKLQPGGREVWTAKIKLPGGDPAKAVEMVGTLYDASLDALFGGHSFPTPGSWFDPDLTGWGNPRGSQGDASARTYAAWSHPESQWKGGRLYVNWGVGLPSFESGHVAFSLRASNDSIAPAPAAGAVLEDSADPFGGGGDPFGGGGVGGKAAAESDESGSSLLADEEEEGLGAADQAAPPVAPRTNFNETAFFFPTLVSKDDGTVEMSFEMPESATKWRFLGFAHNRDKRHGQLEGETVTALDFMVRPNPPRFLRVGDEIVMTSRLVNQGETTAKGEATILLRRGRDEEDVTGEFGIRKIKRSFEIKAGESGLVSWRLKVPEMSDWVIYRVSATATFEGKEGEPAKTMGDGEERWLPVLSRRILVRDSATRTLTEPGEATLTLDPLANAKPADQGGPLTVGYTVEAVPRPAWLAVKALPYLMEYPHECSEQVFNRYFANALARHLVVKNPEIEKVFDAWKREAAEANGGEDAFTSPLARNPELKAVMLEETPFLMDAISERKERLRVANLFDGPRVEAELHRAMQQLQQKQMGSGGWPWFSGERATENFYISAYITAGFGRLRKIGVENIDVRMALNACGYLDAEMHERYRDIMKDYDPKANYLSERAVLYLYARSFFLKDRALAPPHKKAFEFWKKEAVDHWNSIKPLQSIAQLAVTMHRLDAPETAKLLMESLRQNSLTHEDLGMHWRQLDRGGYWWWEAPIESQTAIIEAFLEVEGDKKAVNLCQTWLLQQKRTQHWESTKATADAVYAVLVDGEVDLLARKGGGLTLTIGEREPIGEGTDSKAEAGSGRLTFKPDPDSVGPADGTIKIVKSNPGPSWVNVYWQSMQDIAEISARDTNNREEGRDAALALEKSVFVERGTDDGAKLLPYKAGTELQVGDTLVTRLILRNDRIYEFVHIKDHRAAGCEPLDAMSGYRWNSDLWFYQETRDSATHFFIDRLPAGSHVLEYRVKIQHAGIFQSGIGEVECLYAPEFRARSGSLELRVEVSREP